MGMKRRRMRAGVCCLLLCVLNLLLCVVPPLVHLFLRRTPEWLPLLSPAWTASIVLCTASAVLSAVLFPLLLVVEEFSPVYEAVYLLLPFVLSILGLLPIIGWLRTNREKKNGKRLIQIPLTAELILALFATIAMQFFSVPLVIAEEITPIALLVSGAAGVLLPALIFRCLYIWQ